MATAKPTVLVLMGGYWPGHEATGPNQSLRQMVAALSDDFSFRIIARARAPGARVSIASSGGWLKRDGADVHYCHASAFGARGLRRLICETPHDILSLNGFFDRDFTIPALVLKRLRLIPRRPTLLSIRGEMADGALGLKSARKRTYMTGARRAGLVRDVWLHATSPYEAADIARRLPGSRGILQAPNISRLIAPPERTTPTASDGRLRLVFVGRVSRVKNLGFALDILHRANVPLDFDIYGPLADRSAVADIRRAMTALPPHIRITLKGEISNADVPRVMASADLFFMPTLGENFGHAIFEALSCGVPVLISDRTPWRDLHVQQAGWDLPLDQPQTFVDVIRQLANMTKADRRALQRGARSLAERHVADTNAPDAMRRMFAAILADSSAELVPGSVSGLGNTCRASP